ncbi:hypothetical protein IQ251_04065 [Saccharopolyspora sp. HNM0983]|uniref:Uncharacterized protein n=1 Tax=Saccharopolyspora montiporae TaxID=2781240 RepID=A0A929B7H6_9PSEU|nr:hypothetical protein [Saccharopolyspora sp. HNM0983]MBE9373620.1 hypothetical protein [Saccharopolyspora sp. HNM0983]
MADLPAFARGLCDDAAVFPPGLAPLPAAVAGHRRHRSAIYRDLVGPLVLSVPALAELEALLTADDGLQLALTAPHGPQQLAEGLRAATRMPVEVVAAEVAVPGDPATFFAELAGVTAPDVAVSVEVPRDERRDPVLRGCAADGHHAKFRTGGVRAELYPDEDELAGAVRAAVDEQVSFKATAGLHHAVRNTDPDTGFQQHGFVNLLLATRAALDGAEHEAVAGLLADREGPRLAAKLRALDAEQIAGVRRSFTSFGTCSIADPLTELAELDLIPAELANGRGGTA